ncbi:hypothetical protein IGI04_032643, partial [Brassica rapa subsp. trilocularis]
MHFLYIYITFFIDLSQSSSLTSESMPNNKSKHEAIPQDKDLPLLHEYELGREEMGDREVDQGLGQ